MFFIGIRTSVVGCCSSLFRVSGERGGTEGGRETDTDSEKSSGSEENADPGTDESQRRPHKKIAREVCRVTPLIRTS